MGSLAVLFVPLALVFVSVLLFLTTWLEENMLAPRLVAAQSEGLLRNLER